MTGEQVTTYSEDGEIQERDDSSTPRHKSPGSHDIFSCHNAIPPRGCGLGVCKSDVVSQTSCSHCAALAAS
ncbi:hypothetical protein EV363DRAFT_1399705 [Boletus edulis]|nr:hypothetical protein EV363DRAFT_1399705 [Boletus edulis]